MAGSLAASNMPWLISPRICAGARLATTTICLPTSVWGSGSAGEARRDLPPLAAQIDLQYQQLVRVRMCLAFQNRRNAEIKFGKIVEGDRRIRSYGRFHFCVSLSFVIGHLSLVIGHLSLVIGIAESQSYCKGLMTMTNDQLPVQSLLDAEEPATAFFSWNRNVVDPMAMRSPW